MIEADWREEWPSFRLAVVEETAKCVANELCTGTEGQHPSWDELTPAKRVELIEHVAFISMAEGQAMSNLVERGEVP